MESYLHHTLFVDNDEALDFLKKNQATNKIEESEAIAYLQDNGIHCGKLSQVTGKSPSTLRHMARVGRKLIPEVKEMVIKSKITFSHTRTVVSYPASEQEAIARNAYLLNKGTRSLQEDYQRLLEKKYKESGTGRFFSRLSTLISDKTAINASVEPDDPDNPRVGQVVLRYNDSQEFDAICEKLGVKLSDF